MIRFTWLRFRTQATVALGALVVLAVVLAVTGSQIAHAYNTTVAPCKLHGNCAAALSAFPSNTDLGLQNTLYALVVAVPGLIGMFWGAPLAAHEFETGTFRLAWTQGATRTRWLAIKIGVVGALSMAVAGLLSLMVTWWSSPIQKVTMNRVAPGVIHTGGVVPIGYAAFGFALGVTAGVLIRRTLPAMALTLAIFYVTTQIAMPLWVQPHLIAPVQTTSALNVAALTSTDDNNGRLYLQTQPDIPGAWIVSSQIITRAGRSASGEPAIRACASGNGSACDAYIASLHLRQTVTYQPASRYWPFQWYETAILLALAIILATLCVLRIRPGRSAGIDIRHLRTRQPAQALQSSP